MLQDRALPPAGWSLAYYAFDLLHLNGEDDAYGGKKLVSKSGLLSDEEAQKWKPIDWRELHHDGPSEVNRSVVVFALQVHAEPLSAFIKEYFTHP